MKSLKFAIIGGSGLEDPEILKNPGSVSVDTPFGKPSSDFKTGTINGIEVVILSRHGREHTLPPTQVNNRANIRAIQELGCTHILATTACGSLREEIGRGDLIIPDQFIDFTRHRNVTFFETFIPTQMKHTSMADPFSEELRKKLIFTAQKLGLTFHPRGTIVTIEGPRFSTRAESFMFRAWGADAVNMSIAPECILANELKIPYAAIAMSTDYDCWKTDEKPVTWEEVLDVFNRNTKNMVRLIIDTMNSMLT
jgi:5'-methylthioadenosine phosphorylase